MAKKKSGTQGQDTVGRPGYGAFLARLAADPSQFQLPEAKALTPEEYAESMNRALERALLPSKVERLEADSQRQMVKLGALKADLERVQAETKSVNELPTLQDFRFKIQWLTQGKAAEHLRCTTRTIRNLIQAGRLTRMKNGRVHCDDKWSREFMSKNPNARVK